ncbi:MAG: Asp-tRNA(Asn)/Glu-tRNA(Gln) amidotransferase subunit GatA [Anaerolineae bacterium]|nr:Asp-tRNA(Asn)/Glu-tRNA(Gln) amidotransferase subunit GatA [Anaerolineae bacterium]
MLTNLTIFEIITLLGRGEISSGELMQAYVERIQQLEPRLHAFLTLRLEDALNQADVADQQRAELSRRGDAIPPLLGVPLAVKDVLAVAGMPCTAGSKILETFQPPYDATVVARLRAAGAIILGKTNTDEFAMGSSTENSAYGVTHNPWNLERVPGGSSGGSAAAVAARMAPAALGTDTGGSVRQPASFCGVTGIKPTYGRVSRYGLFAYGSSLDSVGALARDVADLTLVFNIMQGCDPRDATSGNAPQEQMNIEDNWSSRGLRVGVPDEYFGGGIQPEVESAVRAAIQTYQSMGAEIIPVKLPHTQYAVPVYYLIAPAEASANLARYDGLRYGPRVDADDLHHIYTATRGALFGRETKRRIMLGTYALSAGYQDAYYGKAQKVRALIRQDFERAFKQVDMIAAPVAPTTAFKIGAHSGDPLAMYLEDIFTLPANLAGVPGVAFPVGLDHENLPIGMQLLGPHFQEQRLLNAAHRYQLVSDWHKARPAEASILG